MTMNCSILSVLMLLLLGGATGCGATANKNYVPIDIHSMGPVDANVESRLSEFSLATERQWGQVDERIEKLFTGLHRDRVSIHIDFLHPAAIKHKYNYYNNDTHIITEGIELSVIQKDKLRVGDIDIQALALQIVRDSATKNQTDKYSKYIVIKSDVVEKRCVLKCIVLRLTPHDKVNEVISSWQLY